MTEKRRPLRKKVRTMVLTISLASLLLTSTMGIFSMVFIKSDSETALVGQMEQDLRNLVISKARLAESELGKYAGLVQTFADYLHELYLTSGAIASYYIPPVEAENTGHYTMQRGLANRGVSLGDVREDLLLLGNVFHIWKPALDRSRNVITSLYLGTRSGLMLGYDKQSPVAVPEEGENDLYFDYFSSIWYRRVERTRELCFTDIYQDAFGNGMIMTCAAPFYDAKGEFAGVTCMDIQINDLYRLVVELDLGKGAYAFLLDRGGNLLDSTGGIESNIRNLFYDQDIGFQIASQILKDKTGVTLSREGTYYAYTPIPSTGWKLCIRVPDTTVLAPVRSMNRSIVITIFLFIAAFAVIIALVALGSREFSDRLTGPIAALEKDVEKISDGNLEYRAKIHDNDEVGDLARAFNNMAVSLKEYIMDFAAVTAEKERIGAELNIATKIQEDLLPCEFPPFPDRPEFDVYATMTPAKEVGGDFYDFFFIDKDHLALIMADVAGKGVPAALFMAIAKTLIKDRAQMGGTPSEILGSVNDQLCDESKAELFVTVWLGILELSTGKMTAANAGHEYPVLMRSGGVFRLMKLPNSPAVATLRGLRFREDRFMLHPGDSLFLYTDGVAEATHTEGNGEALYGTDRMVEALNRHSAEPVEELLMSMKREVDAFVGDSPQFDDMTMLALKYYGKEGKGESRRE